MQHSIEEVTTYTLRQVGQVMIDESLPSTKVHFAAALLGRVHLQLRSSTLTGIKAFVHSSTTPSLLLFPTSYAQQMAGHTLLRYVRGGTAHFRTGASLSKFDISADVEVRSGVSMNVDTNTVRLVWRTDSGSIPSPIVTILESFEGPKRLVCPANEFWIDFQKPEHAHIATRILGTLEMFRITLVYNLRFRIPSQVAGFVSEGMEQLVADMPGVHQFWDRSQPSFSVLRLSGDNLQEMVKVKDCTQKLLLGRTINLGPPNGFFLRHEIWHPFFSGFSADMWLHNVADQATSLIVADRQQERLRLYTQDGNPDDDIAPMLVEKMAQVDAMQHTHVIQLGGTTTKAVIISNLITRAKAVLGSSNATLALLIRCPPRTAQFLQHELNSPSPSIERVEKHFECHECHNPTRCIMLSSCEHVVCGECFERRIWHILADPLGDHFPIECSRDGCDEQILLSDLRKLVPSGNLQSLFVASVDRHIDTFPEKYRTCRTTGCDSVYLASETANIFTCPRCLAQTCTFKNCGKEPHIGWDCRSRWLFDFTIECSWCTTILINTDGRKHLKCSGCDGHVCCECGSVFETWKRYARHRHTAGYKEEPNYTSE